MLAGLFSWVPIIGPIVDGIVSIFKQKTDTDLAKQQDQNKTDVSVIQSRASVLIAMKDDPGTRLARDMIMFPIAGWVFVKVSSLTFPEFLWINPPGDFPESIKYMPYLVFAYLFASAFTGRK